MQLALTAAQASFRDELRTFLKEQLPTDVANRVKRGKAVGKDALNAWTERLNARGWAAPGWPVEHGGTGWSLVERQIYDTECRLAHAPQVSGAGFNMVGPAIIRYGSPELQAEHLPKILSGERWWTQGYSEPNAGSDLASLQTRADSDGDHYIINGRKIWTSGAEHADWIFALVRTDFDAQKQRGITFLLIDMATPGVTVEPLIAFNGKRLWNQVVFEDVRVPKTNRLGEENRGWTVAKSLLGDERLLVSRVGENKRLLSIIEEVLCDEAPGFTPSAELSRLRQRVSALSIRLQALDMTGMRILTEADAGETVGAEPSMLKLKGSELVQAMDELLFEITAQWTLPIDGSHRQDEPPVGPEWAEYVASGTYHHRGFTIAAGSSEVQHNIIAKQVLGL